MTNLSAQFLKFKQNLASKLYEAGLILEGEVHNLVAIDTGRLEKSITTDRPVDHGNIIEVRVGSEKVPYAVFVELGVKQRIYQYHRREGKARPVVYVGVGQHFLERSLENKFDDIRAKIREARISKI